MSKLTPDVHHTADHPGHTGAVDPDRIQTGCSLADRSHVAGDPARRRQAADHHTQTGCSLADRIPVAGGCTVDLPDRTGAAGRTEVAVDRTALGRNRRAGVGSRPVAGRCSSCRLGGRTAGCCIGCSRTLWIIDVAM